MHVKASALCSDLAGKLHWRNTKEQLQLVGPSSLGVALLTAGFVGMVFTIQVPPLQKLNLCPSPAQGSVCFKRDCCCARQYMQLIV